MAGFKGLDKQDVTVDFGQGTEQKLDAKRLPIGSLSVADNVQFTKDKQVRRRYGTEQVATESSEVLRLLPAKVAKSIALLQSDSTVSAPLDSNTLTQSYLSLLGAGYEGTLQLATTRAVGRPAVATANNDDYTVTAIYDLHYAASRVLVVLQDTATQQIIAEEEIASGLTTPGTAEVIRVHLSGSTAYVFYRDTGAGRIYCSTLTLSATQITVASTATVVGSLVTTYYNGWDVQPDGTSFYFAYRDNTPNIYLSKRTFAAPASTTWTTTLATSGSDTAVCLARLSTTPTHVWCYFTQAGDVKYLTATTAGASISNGTYLASAFTATTAIGICAYYAGTAVRILLTASQTSPTHHFARMLSSTAALTAGTKFADMAEIPCTGLFPYFEGSDDFLVYVGRNQGFIYLVGSLSATAPIPTPLGRIGQEVDLYTGLSSDMGGWSNVTPHRHDNKLSLPVYIIRESRKSSSTKSAVSFGRVTVDMSDAADGVAAKAARPTTFAGEAYYGGLAAYAGTNTCGMLYPPKFSPGTGAAGSLSSLATYTFYAVTTYVDVRGKKHYSPIGTTTATGATGYVVKTYCPPIPYDALTFDRTDYTAELYMNPDGVDLWYKVASVPLTIATLGAQVSFGTIDTEPTGAEELLYTTGGAYESIPPALPRWVMSARRRLWAPSPENDTDLFFSSEEAGIGAEEVRWNPYQVVKVPDAGGRITAVVEHNQRVVVFKERATYVLTGDGPSINGQGGAFSVELLSSVYGCESHIGILLVPAGALFKTATNGFWLLGNDYSFQYIGRGVDNYKAATVVASCLVEGQNQARFLLAGDQSDALGGILCYDYAYNQWTRMTLVSDVIDMCVGNDNEVYYLFSDATSRLLREDSAVYNDADESGTTEDYHVEMTTGWINFAGVDGYQRVYWVDLQGTPGSTSVALQVRVFYDYDDSVYVDEAVFTVATGATASKRIARVFFKHQKCEALKLQIKCLDATDESQFGDLTLTALNFRVGVKNTAAPASSGQRSTAE